MAKYHIGDVAKFKNIELDDLLDDYDWMVSADIAGFFENIELRTL